MLNMYYTLVLIGRGAFLSADFGHRIVILLLPPNFVTVFLDPIRPYAECSARARGNLHGVFLPL